MVKQIPFQYNCFLQRNLSGDYENEINNLKNVAEFHRQESAKLESDKNMLQRKLQHYEYAKANDEVSDMNMQLIHQYS